MNTIRILFLGASKRVSLLERFYVAAHNIGIDIKIFSCENSTEFYPISHLATILEGPSFLDLNFQSWLYQTIKENNINIVIPNMDSATVALSYFNKKHKLRNCWNVISSYHLCKIMNDKVLSERFFRDNSIETFTNTPDFFPKIIKNKFGYGSKDQHIVHNIMEFRYLKKILDINNYIIQDYVKGQETTVDFYISPKKGLIGYVLRDRLDVSDGEVMSCITRFPSTEEKELIENIAHMSGWVGCITLQYIKNKDKYYVVEINPRFGGGVTCTIECGLDMPSYILSEYLGIDFKFDKTKNVKMVRARRDFFYEYN